MRLWQRTVLTLVLLAVAAFARADSDDAPPEDAQKRLERNRKLLERWRADPEHYARLKEALEAFRRLPPAEQERLRRLDRELHGQSPAQRARYWRTLERYVNWLERLPPEDRRRVESAASGAERLRIIQELRERQWFERLPRAVQERVRNTPADKRSQLIAELKRDPRFRHPQGPVPMASRSPEMGHAHPLRRSDLPEPVRQFLTDSLLPVLTRADLRRLEAAEGNWQFGKALVDVADANAFALIAPPNPPTTFRDLPADVRQALLRGSKRSAREQKLPRSGSKWPHFALAVTELARARELALPRQLGPSRLRELPPAVRFFVLERLLPVLETKDRERLRAAEGRWPEYPRVLVELAHAHDLSIPGVSLPGPREYWDSLRTALPSPGDGGKGRE